MGRRAVLAMLVVLLASGGLSSSLPTAAFGQVRENRAFKVTFAARSCPQYTDVRANRARNDIMESLEDLGPDTNYATPFLVNPVKEDAPPQSRCQPLADWRFALGRGYETRAVNGPWGSLSKVTRPYASPLIRTDDKVDELDANGRPTGRKIEGAVTVTLTDEQVDLAAHPNSLWTQGGLPDDPVLNNAYPGRYGFATLRCAIDAYNGDNVEWISFPTGVTHVYCYAYYVTPPPAGGQIIVRKVVEGVDAPTQAFRFVGNISFNSSRSFDLTAGPGQPADTGDLFVRAEVTGATPPWDFTEQVPHNFALVSIGCTSALGSPTTSSIKTGRTQVTLRAGDVVTCTYTNRFAPPPGGLVIRKTTLGGVGTFGFAVAGDTSFEASATTTAEGIPEDAAPAPILAPPGDYRITETLPRSSRGSWAAESAECAGMSATDPSSITATVRSGKATVCTFTNRFTPIGKIRVRKRTLNAGGRTGFVILPVATPSRRYLQSATTKRDSPAVRATGDDTTGIALGTYVVQETTPRGTRDGVWLLATVECDGVAVPFSQGRIRVTLTEDDPVSDCTFSNELLRSGVDPIPPTPSPPDPAGGSGSPVDPTADLVVTKRVSPRTISPGAEATYTITVSNRGPATAANVVVAEQRQGRRATARYSTTQGKCFKRVLPVCRLGSIRAGRSATIRIHARPATTAGAYRNRVVAGTSTTEERLRNNVATANLFVVGAPTFVG